MIIPRYIRARFTITNGNIAEQVAEGTHQVIGFDEHGYPSPPQWERVHDLTEEQIKALNISFISKIGDRYDTR